MKFPLFLLSVLCATNTAAFGISGAYERMLYWYAYQLDQQGDGPRVIAKGCAEQFGVKTCNLKQFLTHIAEGPVQVARAQSLPDAINAHNMNPDTAAEIIERSRLTGLYQEYYVYEGVDNTPSLFKAVSRLIGKKTAGKSPDHYPLKQILISRKRIESMRVAKATMMAGNHLRRKFDPSHVPAGNQATRDTPITEGLVIETSERVTPENNLRYIAVDLKEAGRRIQETNPPNAEPPGSRFNLKYELKLFSEDEAKKQNNHVDNIKEIREAKKAIMRNCARQGQGAGQNM